MFWLPKWCFRFQKCCRQVRCSWIIKEKPRWWPPWNKRQKNLQSPPSLWLCMPSKMPICTVHTKVTGQYPWRTSSFIPCGGTWQGASNRRNAQKICWIGLLLGDWSTVPSWSCLCRLFRTSLNCRIKWTVWAGIQWTVRSKVLRCRFLVSGGRCLSQHMPNLWRTNCW